MLQHQGLVNYLSTTAEQERAVTEKPAGGKCRTERSNSINTRYEWQRYRKDGCYKTKDRRTMRKVNRVTG